MQDRLNFFEPWDRLAPNHENQLTRALLVVLRYCPMAHQAWLRLVAPSRNLYSLPLPSFATQRAEVLDTETQPATNEPITGISVLCAAGVADAAAEVVVASDRGQVLDGIIQYGEELVVVLESKLTEFADDRQALTINLHGQPINFEVGVRRISWRDVLATLSDLADEQRGLISGAERMVVTDFLTFVEEHFSRLGPFNTLARCAARPFRIERRLGVLMSRILRGDTALLPGTHQAVTNAYLRYENQQIKLHMYPGDTLEQARALYNRRDIAKRVLSLIDDGWNVLPNFHFGFMARGLEVVPILETAG